MDWTAIGISHQHYCHLMTIGKLLDYFQGSPSSDTTEFKKFQEPFQGLFNDLIKDSWAHSE